MFRISSRRWFGEQESGDHCQRLRIADATVLSLAVGRFDRVRSESSRCRTVRADPRPPDAEVDAEVLGGDVEVETARNLDAALAGDGGNPLDVGLAVDQQRELRPVRDRPTDRRELLGVDDGVGDQEVVEAVVREVDGFVPRLAHDAAKPVPVQHVPEDLPTPDRLGGDADRPATGPTACRPDVRLERTRSRYASGNDSAASAER